MEFRTAAEWRRWLDTHHADTDGIWLKRYKKGSGVESITYAEALDEALCFGWIDGQAKGIDDKCYMQKFTPRRKNSLWSKRNIEYVARLVEVGRMTPAGMAEVERAKQDGRWDQAYDKPSEMVVPEAFLAELAKYPKAEAFFKTLNRTNVYAIVWRLQTAKTEVTRLRRQSKIIVMLDAQQKLH